MKTDRRSRCPGGKEPLTDPKTWSRLTVAQTKLAAEVYRKHPCVFVTGSWRFTPAWAESVDACLDLMYWCEERMQESIRFGLRWVFNHCGTLYVRGNNAAIEAYEYTNRSGDPLVRCFQLCDSQAANAVLAAHEYIVDNFEAGGFSHRRNRLALISTVMGVS